MNFTNAYYENQAFWGNLLSNSAEKERLQKTLSLIPEDVHSILDVGCGDGAFVNNLPEYYRVMAVDRCRTAMQYVAKPKFYASIEYLPFKNNSFDLVVCAEVIEHLPYDVYKKGLTELQRVARKYIIISVPNSENILAGFVKCPICNCQFNANRHIRSFTKNQLSELFESFKVSTITQCGPINRHYPSVLIRVKHFVNSYPSSLTALCPQCGFNGPFEGFDNFIGLLCKILKRLFFHYKASKWLIAIYESIKY